MPASACPGPVRWRQRPQGPAARGPPTRASRKPRTGSSFTAIERTLGTVYAPAAHGDQEEGTRPKIWRLRPPKPTRKRRSRRTTSTLTSTRTRSRTSTRTTSTTTTRSTTTTSIDEDEDEADEVDEILTPSPAAVVEKSGEGRRRGRGRGARRRGRRGQPGRDPQGASGRRGRARGRGGHRPRGPDRGQRAGPAQAARRVRLPLVLPGQAPQPAGRHEEDALPGLCLRTPTPTASGRAGARCAGPSTCASSPPSASR